jgi:hypothetical protein
MATKTYDWSDPCQRVLALREIIQQFYTGQRVASVSFNSGDGAGQTATFKSADLSDIKEALREAETECAAANGAMPSRRCIRSGYALHRPLSRR